MPAVTVSDASCLILFHKIGDLDLLKKVFGEIQITETVSKEYGRQIPPWIKVTTPSSKLDKGLSSVLDPGEATSIALASEIDNALLIIDEMKGRKVANQLGLQITGSLGVLVVAKENGHIDRVKPILEKLERTNFRISQRLISKVLEWSNES